MAALPRIITVRIKPGEEGTAVLVEHGLVELERKVPEAQGIVRMAIIMDPTGKLMDLELVTSKLET